MTDQNSQFFAILTAVGEAKQANAAALGTSWTFAQMAVGDANGTDPIPSRTQTKLINERRRAPLNQVKVDPANASVIIAEQIIPESVGGWWVRELALYDADGDMVAVANCAPTFKPLLTQGSGRTQVIRINLIVSSTANIELKIDPSVVLATREYVDTQIVEAMAKTDFKHSVLVATTANIALSGVQTIDGVLLPADARVLVKNQTAAKENGLYVVSSTGVWKRTQDADSSVEVTPGLFVSVEIGNTNGDSIWQLATDAPIVLGTTALVFEMVTGSSGVVAGSYSSVTVDRRGRVIGGTNPATLAGHGITDAYTTGQVDQKVLLALEAMANLLDPLPFAALDFPTVATSDGRLAITAAVAAGSGGTVSVPAGVRVALAEQVEVGQTGRPRMVLTTSWSSAALVVNTTYYLRAAIENKVLAFYVATGTDTDPIPASQRSKAGQSGAGFDSTVIDILLAKVVTGAAGTAPTVTPLANKKRLEAAAFWSAAAGSYSLQLNWARSPRAYVSSFGDYDSNTKSDYTIVAESVGPYAGGVPSVPTGGFSDRNAGRVLIGSYIPTGTQGSGLINVRIRWDA